MKKSIAAGGMIAIAAYLFLRAEAPLGALFSASAWRLSSFISLISSPGKSAFSASRTCRFSVFFWAT
ncbi:hypothetical protein [Allobaculum sp. Allo2]|uniref:hypothetical protein n=1 Tax=Allobaculum sp. Allo2 TaxID=2853432 RepID=UPI001F621FDC|nr:hypothetical protein [Allobaculum sp. Allo2]